MSSMLAKQRYYCFILFSISSSPYDLDEKMIVKFFVKTMKKWERSQFDRKINIKSIINPLSADV